MDFRFSGCLGFSVSLGLSKSSAALYCYRLRPMYTLFGIHQEPAQSSLIAWWVDNRSLPHHGHGHGHGGLCLGVPCEPQPHDAGRERGDDMYIDARKHAFHVHSCQLTTYLPVRAGVFHVGIKAATCGAWPLKVVCVAAISQGSTTLAR